MFSVYTQLHMDSWCSDSAAGARDLFLLQINQVTLGSTLYPIHWITRTFSLR